jgi:hypothetical protein
MLRPIENAAANVAGPASGPRGGNHLTHSSQGTLVGAGIVTDTIRLSKASAGNSTADIDERGTKRIGGTD